MILMYGASNSGKSTFMNYIQKIFKGYDNREASDRFGMWIKFQDTKASLVVADEWEPRHLNERNINEFKRMGEGGGTMYETKGYDPFIAFKGAYFLFSANSLHPILSKNSEELEPQEKTERAAIKARMSLHQFKVSYKNTDKLPYKIDDIALALHYLYQENKNKEYVAEPLLTQMPVKDENNGDDGNQIQENKVQDGYVVAHLT